MFKFLIQITVTCLICLNTLYINIHKYIDFSMKTETQELADF